MKTRQSFIRIFTAGLMLMSPAQPASASDFGYYFGETDQAALQGLAPLDDKGMMSFIGKPYELYHLHDEWDQPIQGEYDPETGTCLNEAEHHIDERLIAVFRQTNQIAFVLRDGLDSETAEAQIFAAVQKYYPDVYDVQHAAPGDAAGKQQLFGSSDIGGSRPGYTVSDRSETGGSSEIASGLMRDLAQAGLISAFYTWGETGYYEDVLPFFLTAYQTTHDVWDGETHKTEKVPCDWEAVGAWVSENYPEYECFFMAPDDTETLQRMDAFHERTIPTGTSDSVYVVLPPEGTGYEAHFAVAAALYEQFGLRPVCQYGILEADTTPVIGRNALAEPGDLNLDCDINIADAVMLARFAAEDTALDIPAAGMGNADFNADGTVDALDLAAMLRQLANTP